MRVGRLTFLGFQLTRAHLRRTGACSAQRLLEARAADAHAAAELRRVKGESDAKNANLRELDQLRDASAAELARLGGLHESVSALQTRLLQEERAEAQAAHAQRRRDWQTEYGEERRQAEGALADLRRQAAPDSSSCSGKQLKVRSVLHMLGNASLHLPSATWGLILGVWYGLFASLRRSLRSLPVCEGRHLAVIKDYMLGM